MPSTIHLVLSVTCCVDIVHLQSTASRHSWHGLKKVSFLFHYFYLLKITFLRRGRARKFLIRNHLKFQILTHTFSFSLQVFFVLRKKHNQITFLHMYHHTVMPMVSWGAAKYYPGGHGTFIGTINSFVHVIMYTYYALAALGDQWQKYLWWKKYITTLQLLQFCIAFIHSSQLLFTDCGYPRWSVYFTLPNAIFFYYLFSDFYNKAYGSSTPKGKGKDGKEVANGVPNGKAQMNGHNGVALSNGKMETAKTK
jgi:GNS1/SUR4 family.